jgi:hypothetical protein
VFLLVKLTRVFTSKNCKKYIAYLKISYNRNPVKVIIIVWLFEMPLNHILYSDRTETSLVTFEKFNWIYGNYNGGIKNDIREGLQMNSLFSRDGN